jgi:hypothetical protein
MEAPTRSPGYDRFKLIVAIILLLIFLFLLWIRPAPRQLSNIPITRTADPAIPSPTASSISDSPTWTPPPFPTATGTSASNESTSTPPLPLSPSATSASIDSTATPPPPPDPSATSTPLSPPSATPMPEATSTPLAASETPIVSACDAATSRARLQTGMNATILRRLNFRSSPGIRDNRILTNIPGTKVEVVGGPECVPYWTGAYLWWQIKLPDGRIGWSAEGSLHGSFHFMEPIP